jgi:hypothetical protein
MVAETSCPGIRGKETNGFLPRKEFRSLPHKPTIRTFNNRPSSVVTTGSGTDSIFARPGFSITSAFTEPVFLDPIHPYSPGQKAGGLSFNVFRLDFLAAPAANCD